MNSVIVLYGPSGVGKSTCISRLLSDYPNSFAFSVSHTTREKRTGETDGIDYHFINFSEFQRKIKNKEFIETTEFSGNWYGTSFEAVENVGKLGKCCILDLDIQGVKSLKALKVLSNFQKVQKVLYVKLVPKNITDLKQRLIARGDTPLQAIKLRIEAAKRDLLISDSLDFDHCIISKDRETTYNKFEKVFTKFCKNGKNKN